MLAILPYLIETIVNIATLSTFVVLPKTIFGLILIPT